MVQQYGASAARLMLTPASAKNAQGTDLSLRLNTAGNATRGESLLSLDVKGTLKPALAELKEMAIRRTHEARAESLELQHQVDRNEEERAEYLETIAEVEARLKKQEERYLRERGAMERQLHQRAQEASTAITHNTEAASVHVS